MKKTVFLFMAAAVAFAGCTKDSNCKPARIADVYAVGYKTIGEGEEGRQVAAFWKNGVDQNLSQVFSQATSVFVSGNDVYIVGTSFDSGHNNAILWKNGVAQQLGGFASANFVLVRGNDVYVAGEQENTENVSEAVLWKNGVLQRLSEGQPGRAHSLYISGNDVYVAGVVFDDSFNGHATLWKNGVAQSLGGNDSYAYSVAISGSDVYVSGADFSQYRAILWKNGVPQTIFEGITSYSPWNIVISDNNIYIAGTGRVSSDNYAATLLKNGVPQYLTTESSSALSLMALNGDIYVAGYRNVENGSYPIVWKNGVEQILSTNPDYGIVWSVFAK